MAIELHKNIVVEPVGDDLLVCDLKGSTVAMLSGSHANVVRAVIAGDEVPTSLTHLLDELITRGVLRDTSASSLFSRRKALGLAAGAAGAGFLTLAMPQVAFAASGCVLAQQTAVLKNDSADNGWDICVDLSASSCGFVRVELSLNDSFGTIEDSFVVVNELPILSVPASTPSPVYVRGVLPNNGGFSNVVTVTLPPPPPG